MQARGKLKRSWRWLSFYTFPYKILEKNTKSYKRTSSAARATYPVLRRVLSLCPL